MKRYSDHARAAPCCAVTLSPSPALLRGQRPARGPSRGADALQVHLDESHRFLAGHDAIADLAPRSVLHGRRIADRHRARGDLPHEAGVGWNEREVAHAAVRVRTERVRLLALVPADDRERVEQLLAVGGVAATLDD